MNRNTSGFSVLTLFLSFLKLMSIESVMPLNYLILSRPSSPPAFSLSQHQGFFPMSWLFASGSQTIGASASASVLPMEYSGLISFRIDWFDLLESPRDSQESSPAPEFESINFSVLNLLLWSNSHICT